MARIKKNVESGTTEVTGARLEGPEANEQPEVVETTITHTNKNDDSAESPKAESESLIAKPQRTRSSGEKKGANEKKSKPVSSETPTGPDNEDIKEVIRKRGDTFTVYLDTKLQVRWILGPESVDLLNKDPATRRILSRAQLVAAIPASYLSIEQRQAWMRIIGEAVTLALLGDADMARDTLRSARDFLIARAREIARLWSIEASLVTFLVLAISISAMNALWGTEKADYSTMATAVLFGLAGAQFSLLSRLNTLTVDPAAGRLAHYTDAFIRILMGGFAAVIVFVVIKGKIFFSVIPEDNNWMIWSLAILSGVSERFVPSFLHTIETRTLDKATADESPQQRVPAEEEQQETKPSD